MDKKESTLSLLKRFIPYMDKKSSLIPVSLLLSALSAIFSIIPFVMVWYILRGLFDASSQMDMASIMKYGWIAFGSAILSVIMYFASLITSHLAAFHVEIGMQKVGMKKIIHMPIGFFELNPSGRIRKVVNEGASTTHGFLAHQLPDIAGSLVTPIILIILLFAFDWRMGIASLIPIVLGFISMSFMMTEEGRSFQKQYNDTLEEMSSEAVEYVRGIPVVKTFGQSVQAFDRFYNSIIKYKKMVIEYTLMWKRPMSFYSVMMQSAAFFLLPITILLIGRGESMSSVIVDFVFYVLISPIFGSILMRSMHFQENMLVAHQAIDRLDNLLDYPMMDDKDRRFSEHKQKNSKTKNLNSIEFKDVVFSYDGALKPAANHINFKVNAGETVALVGPSGGGKTTIARLAARFWDVDQGEVLIGGANVKDINKETLMDQVAFVFQNTKLFKTSLRENIQFGKNSVKKHHIEKALEASRSKEIIDQLPKGLDEVIGTKGTYLSGGEQQRISIARAMVKDASVILLDEATAFADPENEHLIQASLKELSKGKTTLMIAHRLTSVVHVDRILVIEDGKIIEEGNHKQLLKQEGRYYDMWHEYQKSVAWKLNMRPEVIGG